MPWRLRIFPFEFSMGRKWTLDTQVGMNFFFYTQDATSSRYKTKKASHWLVQPELRYWTCDVFNGWFFGLHAHGGQMNIGGIDVPFVLQKGDGKMKEHRYEGYFWGGGLSAGYQWVVSNRFNIEASLGIGYVHTRYDKYKCTTCGKKGGEGGMLIISVPPERRFPLFICWNSLLTYPDFFIFLCKKVYHETVTIL